MSVEYFKDCGNAITVGKAKTTIVMTSYFHASAYGAVPISSYSNQIHKWTFKINKKGTNSIAIGIDDSNGINDCPFGKSNSNNYCYWDDGKKGNSTDGNDIPYHIKWSQGDIIVMIYNGLTHTLSYNVNNTTIKPAFEIKTTNHCMWR
eukprot:466524_1